MERIKNSCKEVVAVNFQEVPTDLSVTALQALRSPLLTLLLPFLSFVNLHFQLSYHVKIKRELTSNLKDWDP